MKYRPIPAGVDAQNRPVGIEEVSGRPHRNHTAQKGETGEVRIPAIGFRNKSDDAKRRVGLVCMQDTGKRSCSGVSDVAERKVGLVPKLLDEILLGVPYCCANPERGRFGGCSEAHGEDHPSGQACKQKDSSVLL
jgi:hypothetical protein